MIHTPPNFSNMKKLFFTIFFFGFFLYTHNASAALLSQQTSHNNSADLYPQVGEVWDSPTNFGSSQKIGSIVFYLNTTNHGRDDLPTCQASAYIQDNHSTSHTSENHFVPADVSLTGGEYTFTFADDDTIDFSTDLLNGFGVTLSAPCSEAMFGHYTDSDVYAGAHSNYAGTGHADDIFFKIYDQTGVPLDLTFTSPTDGENINAGYFLFEGTCPTVETDKLQLTRHLPGAGGLQDQQIGEYDIDCESGYTWQKSLSIAPQEFVMYVVEKGTGEFSTVNFNAGDTNGNLLGIEYPPDNVHHALDLPPGDVTVRFKYTYDQSYRTSTGNGGLGFRITSCDDATYTSCDTLDATTTNMTVLDGQQTGYFTQDYNLTNGQTDYWKGELLGQRGEDQNTLYTLNFSLTGNASSTNASVPPDLRDLGYCVPLLNICLGSMFRDLFVPSYGVLGSIVPTISGSMQGKAPFAYFYLGQEQVLGIDATSTVSTIGFPYVSGGTWESPTVTTTPLSTDDEGFRSVVDPIDVVGVTVLSVMLFLWTMNKGRKFNP